MKARYECLFSHQLDFLVDNWVPLVAKHFQIQNLSLLVSDYSVPLCVCPCSSNLPTFATISQST